VPASVKVKPVFAAWDDSPPAKFWFSSAICWVICEFVTSPAPELLRITWMYTGTFAAASWPAFGARPRAALAFRICAVFASIAFCSAADSSRWSAPWPPRAAGPSAGVRHGLLSWSAGSFAEA
jgi:hypothetical protein